jgi:hypothetical protein
MGVFDTIKFDCPVCEEKLKIQTKAGKCMLTTYTLEQLEKDPTIRYRLSILDDISGRKVKCTNCDYEVQINVFINADVKAEVR